MNDDETFARLAALRDSEHAENPADSDLEHVEEDHARVARILAERWAETLL